MHGFVCKVDEFERKYLPIAFRWLNLHIHVAKPQRPTWNLSKEATFYWFLNELSWKLISIVPMLTVQLCCLLIQLQIGIVMFACWCTSQIIPLCPIILQFLGILALQHNFRQFRFQLQVAFGWILIRADFNFGIIRFHSSDCIGKLLEFLGRQGCIAQFRQFPELSFENLIFKRIKVERKNFFGFFLKWKI